MNTTRQIITLALLLAPFASAAAQTPGAQTPAAPAPASAAATAAPAPGASQPAAPAPTPVHDADAPASQPPASASPTPEEIARGIYDIVDSDAYQMRLSNYNNNLDVLSPLHRMELERVPADDERVRWTRYMVNVAVIDKGAKQGEEKLAAVAKAIGERAIAQDPYLYRISDYIQAIYSYDQELASEWAHKLIDEFTRSGKPERIKAAESLSKLDAIVLTGEKFEIEGLYEDKEVFNWAAMRGKLVLMEFWDSESEFCLNALPFLLELYGKYHQAGLEFIGVNADEKQSAQTAFELSKNLPWRSISIQTSIETTKPDGTAYPDLEKMLHVSGYPTFFLFDAEGKLLFFCSTRVADWKERLQKRVRKAYPDVK